MTDWIDAIAIETLTKTGKCVVRVDGQQILIMQTDRGVRACQNRCPHEGFPLSEGELLGNGVLRCNWHSWTFDLESGETLVGGDTLLQFPAKVENGRVMLRPVRPDPEDARRRALAGIVPALADGDVARLLRETARLEIAGGDPLDAIVAAIAWVAPRLEYGTTHAIAGAADWISLASAPDSTPDGRLAAFGEILGHIADDGRREGRFPYATGALPWSEGAFLAAIEAANEVAAIEHARGALAEGATFASLVPVLASAALAHYADFGHSLIYVVKSAELADRLGERAVEPLLCLLIRSLCYARREDLLPEFRAYAGALRDFSRAPIERPAVEPLPLLTNASVATAVTTVAAWSATHDPRTIFRTLVDSAALALGHCDEAAMVTTSGSIANNVGWLDHTHAITFAEAGERVASQTPELWAPLLLQLACFIGRNHAFVISNARGDGDAEPRDPEATLAALRASLFDHGRERFIISVHLIKTLFAATNLIRDGSADAGILAPSLDRFFHAPMKGRHVIRTARQMLALAADRV